MELGLSRRARVTPQPFSNIRRVGWFTFFHHEELCAAKVKWCGLIFCLKSGGNVDPVCARVETPIGPSTRGRGMHHATQTMSASSAV